MLVHKHVTLSRDAKRQIGFGSPVRDEMMNRRCFVVPFPLLKGTLGSMGW
jgi:hypothetical protein